MDKSFEDSSVKNAITKIIYVFFKSGNKNIIVNIQSDDLIKLSRTLYGVDDTLQQHKINKSVLTELSDFFNCNIKFNDNLLEIEKRA